ncbi:thioesterase family protein [Kitasatospora brasiliensis]|uniref:thioesterase family protein n=1 Tax=Kitasatospora brasiliensis TaxID=3058040 RepID=UPI00292E5CE6|nr:thioesterase family protein [Kitasatospora sp. K002]
MNHQDPPTTAAPAPLPEAFYRELGPDRFAATTATAGPWSPHTQHAGPPCALLGRALHHHDPRPGLRIARVTVDLPRPVPVGELHVSVRTLRSGRRAELLEGEITSDGRTVLLARAWRLATSPPDTPVLRPAPPPPPPPLPGAQRPHTMAGAHLDGYIAAMEWRFQPGGGFDVMGPGTVWARQRIPLIAGREDTALTRALVLADSNWAVAFELDHHKRFVINTDVTLVLHRDPVGPWLCLRSDTAAGPDGSGLARGWLADTAGECGLVLQTLLVDER